MVTVETRRPTTIEELVPPLRAPLPSELLERGWCPYVVSDDEGRICAMGAINQWAYGHVHLGLNGKGLPGWEDRRTRLATSLSRVTGGHRVAVQGVGGVVADWNDAPGRTQAEVVAAMRRAEEECGLW